MESKTKQKINLLKKTNEDEATSVSDDSLPVIECEICELSFSVVKSYDFYLKAKKYHKMVSQAKFLAEHKMDGFKKGKDNLKIDDDNDVLTEIHCEKCDKIFSGHISYTAHLKGKTHAKYVKKQKLKTTCSTCQKKFSGSFSLHMKSAYHKKKVELIKMLGTLLAESQTESKESDDEDDIFSNCDVCQKSFSGPVPYQIHMNSSVHKKNLEKKRVADEMKGYYSKDTTVPGYVCNECKNVFIDPIDFKYHLTNNNHEKQKAKSALMGFLKAYLEIAYVLSFDENAEEESDRDSSSQDYNLFCKICYVSFSDLESAEDHVKSKKHISAKTNADPRVYAGRVRE